MLDNPVSCINLSSVPPAPEDPLYRLMREYREDHNARKIDLGIGAYRDEAGNPWLLPVVKKVSHCHFEVNGQIQR